MLAVASTWPTNPTFQMRYAALIALASWPVWSRVLQATWAGLERGLGSRWSKVAWVVCFTLQIAFAARFSMIHRRDLGRVMIAVEKIYRAVEQQFPNSVLVFAPGFIPYGYHASPAASIRGRTSARNWQEITSNPKNPVGNTLVASWGPTLDAQFTLFAEARGCAAGAFELLFPCGPTDGAFVLKYVGLPQELRQAEAADKKGGPQKGKAILEAYVGKEPLNQGAQFVLGVYAYRTSDFAAMERIYDALGPFFPGNVPVTYNRGIAKLNVSKFDESIQYFTQAREMQPRSYEIGFNLADAYARSGDTKRAAGIVKQLIAIYPNDPSLKSALQRWGGGT